jgi:hypothetical protein
MGLNSMFRLHRLDLDRCYLNILPILEAKCNAELILD